MAPEARNRLAYRTVRRMRTVRRGAQTSRSRLATRASKGIGRFSRTTDLCGTVRQDPIAGFRNGLDDRRVAKLGAESAHRDLHRVRERIGRLIPDSLEELLCRNNPPL